MSRILFWVSTAFWLVMMGLLIRNEILPNYTVEENAGYASIVRGIQGTEAWEMAVFKDGEEVGTSHTTVDPKQDGSYVISNGTNIEVRLGMLVSKVQATLEVYVGKDKELDRLFLTVAALGSRADLTGVREGDKLKIKAALNGQTFEEEMPYENGLVSSYFEPFAVGRRLKVGQAWRTRMLDPLSQKFTNAEVKVVGKETLKLALKKGEAERTFETYKIVMDWGTNRLQAWATEDGRVLKEETPLGYTLVYREASDDDSAAGSVEILRREMRRKEPDSGN